MKTTFDYRPQNARKALELDGYYVWDCSVVKAEGKYHMFSSRWKEELGFGWNWLLNSEIIHSVADRPEGPYRFERVVLPRRSREFFDGMNTHNTCIREWNGKYYLYYMGTTYDEEITALDEEDYCKVWNVKRIGVAVADSIYGEFVRKDEPVLLPRDSSHWDCTATTNPAVAILPSGKTYMIYKSRSGDKAPLQLGIAVADRPDGEFVRLSDEPILQFGDEDMHIEDPYLWYDALCQKFCLIAKDDPKNGSCGITGEWGAGFYAESDDCINFEIPEDAKVYSRTVTWADGSFGEQGNLERPSLLFDENGIPTHIFFAGGEGSVPYHFDGGTRIIGMELVKK